MGLFLFLTVVQAIVAATLVILVLMQRSEGGGLGIGGGGGPGGLMSARGAADFLTRATKWAAVLFVVLAIVLAGVGVEATGTREIDQSLDRSVSTPGDAADDLLPIEEPGTADGASEPSAPADEDPLAGVAE